MYQEKQKMGWEGKLALLVIIGFVCGLIGGAIAISIAGQMGMIGPWSNMFWRGFWYRVFLSYCSLFGGCIGFVIRCFYRIPSLIRGIIDDLPLK